jgi:hypothetical protein
MNPPNLLCISCENQLFQVGLLLTTQIGPFVCCDVCRALYYIDVVVKPDNTSLIVIQPTRMPPEEEFDIIRHSISSTPLKECLLPPKERSTPVQPQDLKSVITSSVTPSDLIRRLHDSK